jgi:RNA polymerase sigma-70 factor, ECF subfamily
MPSTTIPQQLPHHLPRLWRFAVRLTRNGADAEDLVQRTCVRALEKKMQWQLGSNLLAWLFAIMHSIWMNELRQRRTHPEELLDENWLDIDQRIHHETPEQSLSCQQILRLVDDLPEGQRLVLNLIAVEGMTYQEAASVLEVPIGTIMSRLARARLNLESKMLLQGGQHASIQ